MKLRSVDWFRCTVCDQPLRVKSAISNSDGDEIAEGLLVCTGCDRSYPIVRSIPRFVPSEEYARSFGYQWNYFDKMQLDSYAGNALSRQRFFATTQWPQRMEGQTILEAGCGMGRFSEIALETGAEVISFDLSNAVDANYGNNGKHSSVHIIQANIYNIPLRKAAFDKVFCMGVLQHCPDVRGAFMSLVRFLRPGGEIVIDVYQKHTAMFPPLKYWVRPLLTWMGAKNVHKFLSLMIPPAFYLKKAIYRIPIAGKRIGSLIPIGPISHAPRLLFTDEELVHVKILSALDMFSPVHDYPQTLDAVRQWFNEAGLVGVYVGTGFNGINARGRRPKV